MVQARLSGTKIGVGALIALTLATGVATVVNLQSGEAASGPTATATSPTETEQLSPAAAYVIELIQDRHVGTSTVVREQTLADVLPNHLFSVAGSEPVALAAGTVIGTVSSVEPGAAYVSSAESNAGDEVAFDSTDAEWRVVIVTIAVDSAVGEVTGDSTVRLGIAVDGAADIATAIEGYQQLGRVIVVLDAKGTFELDSSLYSARQGGALFGLVADDGSITFPAQGDNNAAFLDGLNTVTDVLSEATGPDVISEVERAGAATSQD